MSGCIQLWRRLNRNHKKPLVLVYMNYDTLLLIVNWVHAHVFGATFEHSVSDSSITHLADFVRLGQFLFEKLIA